MPNCVQMQSVLQFTFLTKTQYRRFELNEPVEIPAILIEAMCCGLLMTTTSWIAYMTDACPEVQQCRVSMMIIYITIEKS